MSGINWSLYISMSNAFLLLLISSWSFHDVCQCFFYVPRYEILVGSDKKMKIFPIDPRCKNAHFGNVMSLDMALQKWAVFYNGGLWGTSMFFCRIKLNFRFWPHTKYWLIAFKYQFENNTQVKTELVSKSLWQTWNSRF